VTPEEEIQRAERAALLLNEPLMAEAFETIETKLRDAWETSPARDVDGRETLWLSIKLLKQLKSHLTSVIETGQLASEGLARRGIQPSDVLPTSRESYTPR
jgi:hypothetical protein